MLSKTLTPLVSCEICPLPAAPLLCSRCPFAHYVPVTLVLGWQFLEKAKSLPASGP